MSRIGKKPITVPDGVKVGLTGNTITIEGPKGKVDWAFRPEIDVQFDEQSKEITCSRKADDRLHRGLHGTTRSLIENMIVGVTQGYERRLEIVGVGYLGAVQQGVLQLRVGFANEIQKKIPAGLEVVCPDQTHVVVRGTDKQQVAQFAAEVRAVRKPEPYKGKGIRYEGEQIRRKAGKTAK